MSILLKKPDTKQSVMPKLQAALDAESYEWMAENRPDVLEAIVSEVDAGMSPRQIRVFVLTQTQRPEIALRCEQVARHVWTARG